MPTQWSLRRSATRVCLPCEYLTANYNAPLYPVDVLWPFAGVEHLWISVGNGDPDGRFGRTHTELARPPDWGLTSTYGAFRANIAIVDVAGYALVLHPRRHEPTLVLRHGPDGCLVSITTGNFVHPKADRGVVNATLHLRPGGDETPLAVRCVPVLLPCQRPATGLAYSATSVCQLYFGRRANGRERICAMARGG
jgi:hypothetical protein